jgi:hypothetical protein
MTCMVFEFLTVTEMSAGGLSGLNSLKTAWRHNPEGHNQNSNYILHFIKCVRRAKKEKN